MGAHHLGAGNDIPETYTHTHTHKHASGRVMRITDPCDDSCTVSLFFFLYLSVSLEVYVVLHGASLYRHTPPWQAQNMV